MFHNGCSHRKREEDLSRSLLIQPRLLHSCLLQPGRTSSAAFPEFIGCLQRQDRSRIYQQLTSLSLESEGAKVRQWGGGWLSWSCGEVFVMGELKEAPSADNGGTEKEAFFSADWEKCVTGLVIRGSLRPRTSRVRGSCIWSRGWSSARRFLSNGLNEQLQTVSGIRQRRHYRHQTYTNFNTVD